MFISHPIQQFPNSNSVKAGIFCFLQQRDIDLVKPDAIGSDNSFVARCNRSLRPILWIEENANHIPYLRQLDYEPSRFLRRRTVRRKYVHRTEVDTTSVIARLQERGPAAPGLLAHVLVSKYCDHLPLYRQEQIFAQGHKIDLPRQTLAW